MFGIREAVCYVKLLYSPLALLSLLNLVQKTVSLCVCKVHMYMLNNLLV